MEISAELKIVAKEGVKNRKIWMTSFMDAPLAQLSHVR